MQKILILFAHPRLESSRVNARLLESIPEQENITLHDLYEKYPDFNVDIEYEQSLLEKHDIIIFHHPFYWYSSPPLLKQWIDMVLEYGWAYGSTGDKLKGKIIFNAITTGGGEEAYCEKGYNTYSINQFMQPFEQTAKLCLMEYLPPFAVMGTHTMKSEQIDRAANRYNRLLRVLSDDNFDITQAKNAKYLNEIL